MGDHPEIFISYRCSDAAGHARALHRDLTRRFDEDHLFFDRSSLEGGDLFPEFLKRSVAGCKVLVALIGPGWLEAASPTGGRRIDEPGDFVRQEIALALELDKKVIPVLFDDTPMPIPTNLPDSIRRLSLFDGLPLR